MSSDSLIVHIKAKATRSARDIVGELPEPFSAEPRAGTTTDEILVFRANESTTGARVAREADAYVVTIPAFAHPADLVAAGLIIERVAVRTKGAIEIAGRPITTDAFASRYEARVAPRFVDSCIRTFVAIARGRREATTVEGHRRAYALGAKIANHLIDTASDGDPYGRLVLSIAAFQRLAPPTLFPAPMRVRTPDGIIATYATWTPGPATLLPACDYVLVNSLEIGAKIRVPSDRLSAIASAHIDLADDAHTMCCALDTAAAEAIAGRADLVGKRLRMPS